MGATTTFRKPSLAGQSGRITARIGVLFEPLFVEVPALKLTSKGASIMNKCQGFQPAKPISRWPLVIIAVTSLWALGACAVAETLIWDTGSRLANADATERTGWNVVPTELFAFEANPAKASSDPGYYGREYAFRGDAVVENEVMSAVCLSRAGRVVIYKSTASAPLSPN